MAHTHHKSSTHWSVYTCISEIVSTKIMCSYSDQLGLATQEGYSGLSLSLSLSPPPPPPPPPPPNYTIIIISGDKKVLNRS